MVFFADVPREMSPAEYDRRMAEGWFRSGSVLFQADLLCIDDRIRGVVQIRLPLNTDRPGRERRRSLRRNRERFRVEFGPARVDADRQRLYDRTKRRFMSFVLADLEPLVFGENQGVFDTRECAVYDGDRLVAVSYFDVGSEAVASQLGLHDPDYARFGLGKYTLFEEIEWAREQGAAYLYPGYLVPGLPRFDYKLSIGAVQYLEKTRWRRRAAPPARVPAAERYTRRVDRLVDAFRSARIPVEVQLYSGFFLATLPELEALRFVDGLVHLSLHARRDSGLPVIAQPTLEGSGFELLEAIVEPDLDLVDGYEPLEEGAERYEVRALRRVRTLAVSESAREIAAAAIDFFRKGV